MAGFGPAFSAVAFCSGRPVGLSLPLPLKQSARNSSRSDYHYRSPWSPFFTTSRTERALLHISTRDTTNDESFPGRTGMTLSEILRDHASRIKLYSRFEPSRIKGFAFGVGLFGPLVIELYFVWKLVSLDPDLAVSLAWYIVPLLIVFTMGAIVISLDAKPIGERASILRELTSGITAAANPDSFQIGCLSRLFLIVTCPFLFQFYISRLLWARLKFHLLRHPALLVAQRRESFALYLRSFGDDPRSAVENIQGFSEDPFRFTRAFATKVSKQDRIEKIVGDVVVTYMPVLCIGRPEESYPISQFGRIFVTDDGWKEVVKALMDAAAIVIVRVGTTPGLQWELTAARHIAIVGKTIFFLCNEFGVPYFSGKLLSTMHDLKIDITGTAIHEEAYFCAFSELGKPIFLPLPDRRPDSNSYLKLRRNTKLLIRRLQEDRPALFKASAKHVWRWDIRRLLRWGG